jgi:hypothetical protein
VEPDEYCRPASLEDLKALIESLNRQQGDLADTLVADD